MDKEEEILNAENDEVNWNLVYAGVIAFLLLLVGLLYWFGKHFEL